MVMFTNEDGSKNQLKTRIAMVVVAIIDRKSVV
jgi:hypothetical protein